MGNAKLVGMDHATPLYASAEKGHSQVVETLLKHCKDVALGNENEDEESYGSQHTPIHIACMNGHVDAVEAFVDYGITLSVMDRRSSVSEEEQGVRELTKSEVGPFCKQIHERAKKAQEDNKQKQEL